MKLLAAKCPSCGSTLDVNVEQETMKCKYCKNAILVDDAIKKYKLEISGEVEIKNLPNIDNYLKLAQRDFENKKYEKAYENYGKILELDPNNNIANLRYAICKTLLNNYIDFTMEYLINAFNEVIKSTSDSEKEEFVKEVIYATDESLYSTRKYYNSYTVNGRDLLNIQNKLISVAVCYESILEYAKESREYIINKIISVINDLLKDKSYKTGSSISGYNFIQTYKTSYNDKIALTKKLKYYKNLLNPDEQNNDNDVISSKKKLVDNHISLPVIIIDVLLCMLIIGSALSSQFLSSLILVLLFLIITFKSISDSLFNGNKKIKKYVIIALIILLIIASANGI